MELVLMELVLMELVLTELLVLGVVLEVKTGMRHLSEAAAPEQTIQVLQLIAFLQDVRRVTLQVGILKASRQRKTQCRILVSRLNDNHNNGSDDQILQQGQKLDSTLTQTQKDFV